MPFTPLSLMLIIRGIRPWNMSACSAIDRWRAGAFRVDPNNFDHAYALAAGNDEIEDVGVGRLKSVERRGDGRD